MKQDRKRSRAVSPCRGPLHELERRAVRLVRRGRYAEERIRWLLEDHFRGRRIFEIVRHYRCPEFRMVSRRGRDPHEQNEWYS